jgi:hypothetical protein
MGELAAALRGGRAPRAGTARWFERPVALALAALALVVALAVAVRLGTPQRIAGAAAAAWTSLRDRVDEATSTRAPAPVPAPARTVAPPARAARPTVELLLRSSPPGAKVVRVDTRERLGTTPLRVRVPRKAASLWVEVTLAGFEPVKLEIDQRRDTTANVTFERVRRKPAAPR